MTRAEGAWAAGVGFNYELTERNLMPFYRDAVQVCLPPPAYPSPYCFPYCTVASQRTPRPAGSMPAVPRWFKLLHLWSRALSARLSLCRAGTPRAASA